MAIAVFLLFGIVNLLFYQGPSNYNNLSEVLGDIILALLCCYILFQLASGDENTPPLATLDYFWLAIGFLVSSLGSAVHYTVQQSLYKYYLATGVNVGGIINTVLNIVLFTCMIIAFYCRWRSRKLLLASSSPLLSS